jgi:hypothetical protein
VEPAGQHGEHVDQANVRARGGLPGHSLELSFLGFVFVVQVGEVGVDAGPQGGRGGVGRVGGQGGQVVDEAVLGGLDVLEPGFDRGGLGIGAGLLLRRPGRKQRPEPFFAARSERIGLQARAQLVEDEVVAGGDGERVVGVSSVVAGVGTSVRPGSRSSRDSQVTPCDPERLDLRALGAYKTPAHRSSGRSNPLSKVGD